MPADFSSRIEHWAARQLSDYDARTPGTIFAEGTVLTVEEGYALQSAVADSRVARGEKIIGYKVGCTSPTIRAQLGIDHCVTGRLYDRERHPSGVALSRADFANLAIEGELAVELSREPTERDFSEDAIPACVRRVIPVIELHHYLLRGDEPSAGELIANNAIHAGFVVGTGVESDDIGIEPSLEIFIDGTSTATCEGRSLIETINSSLRWLTETVRNRADSLGAGQIVLTGSIPPLIPIGESCQVRVDAPPFGSVAAEFL